ncbi:hypothetical protein ACE1SV_66070 [Streptomyces sennicomposti]
MGRGRGAAPPAGSAAGRGRTSGACRCLYAKWQGAEAEIAYLKSPSGAGRNLKNHDKGRDKE